MSLPELYSSRRVWWLKQSLKPLLCLLLLPMAVAKASVNSELDAKQWLQQMTNAVNQLDYQGTFIFLHDNQLELMRIVHGVRDGKPRERLTSLNGAPKEVIRDLHSVTCVESESQQLSVDQRPLNQQLLDTLSDNLNHLGEHYTFHILGKGRVAGRQARVVAIMPKDEMRYGYRFFIDEQSYLPLKSDLMNERGVAVEQTMFTELEVGVANLGGLHDAQPVEQPQATPREQADQPSLPISGRWTFKDLPSGFNLSMSHRVPDPDGDHDIEQYVLTDGLASLSVFVEPSGEKDALEGASRLGAINAWGGELDGYQITVVGEVPTVTLLGVLDAMRLNP